MVERRTVMTRETMREQVRWESRDGDEQRLGRQRAENYECASFKAVNKECTPSVQRSRSCCMRRCASLALLTPSSLHAALACRVEKIEYEIE